MKPAATGPDEGATARDRALFDRIAERYCAKDLHPASRPARVLRLEQTVAAAGPPAGVRILEVGCGAGHAARYLAGRYGSYTGIDHAGELIAYARAHNAGPRVRFETADLADYRDERGFDLVLMIGVLHHFEDLRPMTARAVGLLAPGGWLVANEPQPANPLIHLARLARKRLDPDYSADQTELSLRQIEELYRSLGLVDLRIAPQGLLSTPFAEVMLRPAPLAAPLARLACLLDRAVPGRGRWMTRLSWNLIAAGRRP